MTSRDRLTSTSEGMIGKWWDARWSWAPDLRRDEQDKLTAMVAMIPSNLDSILDVGCGTGWMMEALRRKCRRLIGVDVSLQGLSQVRHADAVVAGSGLDLPFTDNACELAVCAEVLEHYPSRLLQRAVEELVRISARYILVTVPYREERRLNMVRCGDCLTEFHSSLHQRAFDEHDVYALFHQYRLEVVEVRKTGRQPFRSVLLARLNEALTGYHSFWRPGLRCPVCGNENFPRKRALRHPLSLVLEGLNWVMGRILPGRAHNICILLAHSGR